MQLRDIINKLHDDDGLADAGAAERAHLAALQEGANQVDDFDTRREDLRRRGLLDQRRREPVNRIVLFRVNRPSLVNGIAGHIKHSSHDTFTDRHAYWPTAIRYVEAAFETFGAGHGDGSD
jgi:hypothetical protein